MALPAFMIGLAGIKEQHGDHEREKGQKKGGNVIPQHSRGHRPQKRSDGKRNGEQGECSAVTGSAAELQQKRAHRRKQNAFGHAEHKQHGGERKRPARRQPVIAARQQRQTADRAGIRQVPVQKKGSS